VFLAGEGSRHQWYQLPIVPVAAAFGGMACDVALRACAQSTGAKTAAVLCGLFFAALAYLSYSSLKPLYEPQAQRVQAWHVGNALNHIAPADALVIIADDGDPTAIYFSKRKGWHFLQDGMFKGYPVNSQQAIMQLEEWRKDGATYLAFTQYAFWWFDYYEGFREYLDARYRRVRETKEYLIFSLK
jgi:hypothetical protein